MSQDKQHNKLFNTATLQENEMTYVTVTTNTRRNITPKSLEFLCNGDNKEQDYKGNKYYNYSFNKPNSKDMDLIGKIRVKYNIGVPEAPYVGETVDFDINDDVKYNFTF